MYCLYTWVYSVWYSTLPAKLVTKSTTIKVHCCMRSSLSYTYPFTLNTYYRLIFLVSSANHPQHSLDEAHIFYMPVTKVGDCSINVLRYVSCECELKFLFINFTHSNHSKHLHTLYGNVPGNYDSPPIVKAPLSRAGLPILNKRKHDTARPSCKQFFSQCSIILYQATCSSW